MSVPTYTPQSGDRVTVTRHRPDGRVTTCTGRIRFEDTTFTTQTGFLIEGDTHHASADTLSRNHGVQQTIAPATEDAV